MAIKFVPTFITEDGKSYDSVDKAIIHERRRMVQHLLLDQREKLHLTLADIDKAAAVICAVQGQVAGVFDVDMTKDMDISAAREQFVAAPKTVTPQEPVVTRNLFDPGSFKGVPKFPEGGVVGERPEVPPMVHTDIRANDFRAVDALGTPLAPGDLVRLVAGAAAFTDTSDWGPSKYVSVEAVSADNRVRIGDIHWSTKVLVRKAA